MSPFARAILSAWRWTTMALALLLLGALLLTAALR